MNDISGNLRILGIDALTLAIWIIRFFSIIAVVLLFMSLACGIDCEKAPVFWATFIGSCIAIANALLLYATLRSQNENSLNTKEAHMQERFETTFFNLLDYQRRLIEEIVIDYEYVDKNINKSSQEVKGREAFSFANNEIRQISKSLKSAVPTTYNYCDIIPEWEKIKEGLVGEEINGKISEYGIATLREFRNKANIVFHNEKYNICDDDRQSYSTDSNTPYKLFMQKWGAYFERFIGNLECLLQHICENYSDDKTTKKYIKFVQSQMSRDELYFVETHAQSFPHFSILLKKNAFDGIFNNN